MARSKTSRVLIRKPRPQDCAAFLAAVQRSRSLHGRWVHAPDTRKAFAAYLERLKSEDHCGFLVIHRADRVPVGVINLNHIIRGPLQSAFMGYYAFAPLNGRGLMREAMDLVVRFAFSRLKLHRIEANVQPGNQASIALVRKSGFVLEGFSRKYLKVAGRWRDHQRWAISR